MHNSHSFMVFVTRFSPPYHLFRPYFFLLPIYLSFIFVTDFSPKHHPIQSHSSHSSPSPSPIPHSPQFLPHSFTQPMPVFSHYPHSFLCPSSSLPTPASVTPSSSMGCHTTAAPPRRLRATPGEPNRFQFTIESHSPLTHLSCLLCLPPPPPPAPHSPSLPSPTLHPFSSSSVSLFTLFLLYLHLSPLPLLFP